MEVLVAGEEAAINWLFWWLFVGIVATVQAIVFIVVFWLIRAGGLSKLLWFRLRGGSLIIDADKDNSIGFGLAKEPKAVERFEFIDERGEKKMLPVNTSEVKHHLRGTSKPIHICVRGLNENLNLLQQYKADRSAEHLNQWGTSMFQEGLSVGRAMREEDKKWFEWDAGTLFSIIQVCLSLAIAAMVFIVLNNLQPPTG
ncbi:hypothetical protein DRN67_02860 [Candidatus Micrarchaeota archaeon]|nr:MAG: hypothetical protein DRN67_02860 [Candidatus Micrarchaeota archaeon]